MWIRQMNQRCPDSKLVGLGRLTGWHWIINSRRYANVVEIKEGNPEPINSEFPFAWGLVHYVSERDIERLDVDEGVAWGSYDRVVLNVDLWPKDTVEGKTQIPEQQSLNVPRQTLQKVNMYVYVDPRQTDIGKPYQEYIVRINNGIQDALPLGLPIDYTEKVLRHFIPEETPKKSTGVAANQPESS